MQVIMLGELSEGVVIKKGDIIIIGTKKIDSYIKEEKEPA